MSIQCSSASGCRGLRAPAWLAALALLPVVGHAQPAPPATEYNVELGAGVDYSDNIDRRAPGRAEHEWVLVQSVGGLLRSATPDLNLDLDGQLSYLSYLRGTNANTLRGDIFLRSAWEPFPNRLVLHVEDRYRDVPIRERGPLSPDNRERANAVLAGPDLIFRLSPVDDLVLGGRYGYTYFQESPDNSRVLSLARWEHRPSPRSRATLDASYQDVSFQDGDTTDFDRVDGGLGFRHDLPGSTLRGRAGGYRMERGESGVLEGFQGFLGWETPITRRLALDLNVSRDTQDAGGRLLSPDQGVVTLGGIHAAFGDDLSTSTSYAAAVRHETALWEYDIDASYADETLRDTDDDRIIRGVRAGMTMRLPYALRATLSAEYAELRYREDARRDDDLFTSAALRRSFGRHVFAELRYGYAERRSTAAGADFREHVVGLSAGYAYRP